jgi:ubiquinone biosynthesis protein
MTSRQIIIEPEEVAGLVPEIHAELRPLIADAIAFFVSRLSPTRRERLLASQAALPAIAPPDLRLLTLARGCPVLHKLAQVVARHPALDADLRRALQPLETETPRRPQPWIATHLRSALGDVANAFRLEIEPVPLAEASVAVVVPCRWRPAATAAARDAVLKILKPGVADRLEEELAILVELADHLDDRRDDHGLPALDHRDAFVTVRDLLRHEVRLDMEQRHLAAAAELYAHDARVHVPAVLPFSTPAVTAMERVRGRKVTDLPRHETDTARRTAETVVRALVATPVLDAGRSAMFHADPHAGNLLAADDGRLAILDWSLVGHLDERTRVAVAAIALAALRQDAATIAESIGAIACGGPSPDALTAPVTDALAETRRGRLPGPGWLVDLLDGVVRRGVRFPASLMLFRKTLFTLRGVVADIDPSCSIDAVFLDAAMRTAAAEWPRRLVANPFSRAFGTRVSTADLVATWCFAPPALMGAWWSAGLR